MTAAPPLPTHRAAALARLAEPQMWDLAVIGGGATGLGLALDAAQRGHRVVLVEAHDFAQGTSSRATKLVHGGVRYLAQGNLKLVREALRERQHILHSAPHLAQPLPFVMPSHKRWETPFYGVGLKLYDALAGSAGLGATQWLSPRQTQRLLPGARAEGLKGGVKYWDGQFDDARLALAIARTAAAHGALLLNHMPAVDLLHHAGKASGLRLRDAETGQEHRLQARCIVNATGVWVDALRQRDARAAGQHVPTLVAPSQGAHIVVDAAFSPGGHALLVPSTADGRVLFAVPWLGKLILGTTDTPRRDRPLQPRPFAHEVEFILHEAARYLHRAPQRTDIQSAWAGLRPLVQAGADASDTKAISREHTILIGPSGLVTVTGGKWTTYRAMAQDVLARCEHAGLLPARGPCQTAGLRLVGAPAADARNLVSLAEAPGLHLYGTEADAVQALPGADRWLAPGLTEAMVRFAARHEYARDVQDVLARRARLLFLDAAEAARAAPAVAEVLAAELAAQPGPSPAPGVRLQAFQTLARAWAQPETHTGS
ncbi:MAG: glycerol-3-phosphate dehydrogenase/oxidase [Pseudomonadota bacterium]|nr:glycerol-3-phosphate dehydrogenase/oxidase [Pseudomonadota bacterium]